MLNIERVLKQDRLLRAMTGLNHKAFDALLPTFTVVYKQSLLKQPRQRAIGGGRKARLRNHQDKLFFILFYFKCYPTFDLAGVLFDIDRAQVHYWMHRVQPILEAALGEKMALPERKISSIEELMERFPDVKRVIVDGTERPIGLRPAQGVQRPQDPQAQKLNYSGKKKRHTRKHPATVDQDKRILVLSKAREGKLHDKKFHNGNDIIGSVPDEIPVEMDLGFLGVQKQYDHIRIPHKNRESEN